MVCGGTCIDFVYGHAEQLSEALLRNGGWFGFATEVALEHLSLLLGEARLHICRGGGRSSGRRAALSGWLRRWLLRRIVSVVSRAPVRGRAEWIHPREAARGAAATLATGPMVVNLGLKIAMVIIMSNNVGRIDSCAETVLRERGVVLSVVGGVGYSELRARAARESEAGKLEVAGKTSDD